jgi:NADH-quinone oxidoreductase subunit K
VTEPQPYLVLSVLLFSLGMVAVVARRHPLLVLLGLELALQSANLALGALAVGFQDWDGRVTTSLLLTLACAELLIGLGVLWAQHRQRSDHSPPLS